jgi:hypothetical protein
MARPRGGNLSEAERVVYGDKALARKLAGLTYEEITGEVTLHKNSVGRLIRDAARRRAQAATSPRRYPGKLLSRGNSSKTCYGTSAP